MNIKGIGALVKYIPELNSTGMKLLHPKSPSSKRTRRFSFKKAPTELLKYILAYN